MSRRGAFIAGVVAWLVSLCGAWLLYGYRTKAFAILAAASGVATTLSIVAARTLSLLLTKAVLKE